MFFSANRCPPQQLGCSRIAQSIIRKSETSDLRGQARGHHGTGADLRGSPRLHVRVHRQRRREL